MLTHRDRHNVRKAYFGIYRCIYRGIYREGRQDILTHFQLTHRERPTYTERDTQLIGKHISAYIGICLHISVQILHTYITGTKCTKVRGMSWAQVGKCKVSTIIGTYRLYYRYISIIGASAGAGACQGRRQGKCTHIHAYLLTYTQTSVDMRIYTYIYAYILTYTYIHVQYTHVY